MRIMTLFIVIVLLALPAPSLWAENINKTVNRQTFFNDMTDYFATIGKGEHERRRIQSVRKDARRAWRMEKERDKKQAQVQKRLRQEQKNIIRKINAAKRKKQNQK